MKAINKQSSIIKTSSKNLFILSLITVLGFILRYKGILCYWLSVDGSIYINMNNSSIREMLSQSTYHAHPPLYFFILRAIKSIGSDYILNIRIFTLLCGVLCIPLTFLLNLRLFDSRVAIISAFLLAVSPGSIEMSSIIRPYALILLLTILSIYGTIRNDRKGFFIQFFSIYFGIFTHYGFIVLNISLFLISILLRKKSKNTSIRSLLLSQVLINLTAVIIIVTIQGLKRATGGEDFLATFYIASLFDFFSTTYCFLSFYYGVLIAPFMLAILLFGLWLLNKENKAYYFFIPFAVFLIFSILKLYPLGGSRHLIFISPFFLGTISYAISRIKFFNYNTFTALCAFPLIFYSYSGLQEHYLGRLRYYYEKNKLPYALIHEDDITYNERDDTLSAIENIATTNNVILSNSAFEILYPTSEFKKVLEKSNIAVYDFRKNKVINLNYYLKADKDDKIGYCKTLKDSLFRENTSIVLGLWFDSEVLKFNLGSNYKILALVPGLYDFKKVDIETSLLLENLGCATSR